MQSRKRILILALIAIVLSTGTVALAKGWFRKTDAVVNKETIDPNIEWSNLMYRYQQQQANGIHLEGSILLFDGASPDKIKEQSTSVFRSKGKQFFTSISGVRSYCDGDMLMQVDPVNQLVLLSGAPEKQEIQQQMFPQIKPQFNQDNKEFQIVGLVEGDSKMRTLTIQSELSPEIRKYKISYNPGSYDISGIEIEWWKDQRLEQRNNAKNIWITKINYRQYPFQAMDMEAEIKKIVGVVDGNIALIGAEKDYTLRVIE